jgi:hypothetical protein
VSVTPLHQKWNYSGEYAARTGSPRSARN